MENFCKQVNNIKHLFLTLEVITVSFLPVRKSDWECGEEMLVVYYPTTATQLHFQVFLEVFRGPVVSALSGVHDV